MTADPRAQRLLDAQVAWLLSQLDGATLAANVDADLDALLAIGAEMSVDALVSPALAKEVVHLLLERLPASATASTLADLVARTAYDGPAEAFTVGDVVDRDHLEALLDEVLLRADLVGAVLDRVAESPLAAGLASRLVARLVGDVIATNRAVADKIPGLGSLVSLGGSVAGAAGSLAGKQLESLMGDTAGKGTTLAMRRLNRMIVETMKDPAAKEAALQVFDLYAAEPVGQVHRTGSQDDTVRLAGLVQDIVIGGGTAAPVLAFVDALVDGFFAVYGAHPASTLVTDLGLEPTDLADVARRALPPLLAAAVQTGEVERLLRARLEPFFTSPEVAAILEGSD
ncbi:hypothetical protein ACFQ0K_14570 [Nocardioides caeni]|uniref:Uncharacterized protein n=1 Tax=Nocardioides caeni TaxID=574700 RepID=A0A4S8NEU8_9ACTN|nr:hypothetical protein [Nocardioides caeni]THV14601.1 hypothetical protein E9934_07995 [Nocardioides caeni]